MEIFIITIGLITCVFGFIFVCDKDNKNAYLDRGDD